MRQLVADYVGKLIASVSGSCARLWSPSAGGRTACRVVGRQWTIDSGSGICRSEQSARKVVPCSLLCCCWQGGCTMKGREGDGGLGYLRAEEGTAQWVMLCRGRTSLPGWHSHWRAHQNAPTVALQRPPLPFLIHIRIVRPLVARRNYQSILASPLYMRPTDEPPPPSAYRPSIPVAPSTDVSRDPSWSSARTQQQQQPEQQSLIEPFWQFDRQHEAPRSSPCLSMCAVSVP